jgi:hypothetical protein
MAAQLEILGLIDDAHTTASEFAQDAVMGDSLTDHEWRVPLFRVMLGFGVECGQLCGTVPGLKREEKSDAAESRALSKQNQNVVTGRSLTAGNSMLQSGPKELLELS